MKKLLFASGSILLVLLFNSCTKQQVFNRTYFHTILAPKILTLTINYINLRAPLTAWHIHKAAPGVNGSVIFNFGTPQPSGFIYVSQPFTADQENDLMTGNNYVNLHTSVFPVGELRGQLQKY